jgi:hypothetical protein
MSGGYLIQMISFIFGFFFFSEIQYIVIQPILKNTSQEYPKIMRRKTSDITKQRVHKDTPPPILERNRKLTVVPNCFVEPAAFPYDAENDDNC